MTARTIPQSWRYHPDRDALLAEAHARPFTPLVPPTLATRIATLSGEAGAAGDRAHMSALCRRLGQPEPGPAARWCVLDAGSWRLRWERHTEVSTWTFFRPLAAGPVFGETALDLTPQDWLAAWPGEVLVAARMEIRAVDDGTGVATFGEGAIGARVADGRSTVETDFRPDALGMIRFELRDGTGEAAVVGRLAQALFEIETYRLMALMAFPVATEAAGVLTGIEARAAALAGRLAEAADPVEDRLLLDQLAGLAGETEALIGRTSFRFDAAAAYHGLVRERIEQLREARIEGLPTIGEFMQRRLDPAMRTCDAVAERQRAAIDRIARMTQMLNTRVEVAAEATSAALLRSMDRRADLQLRLQQTVEGVSAAAIAYYALGLLSYPLKAVEKMQPSFDATVAAGVLAPLILVGVWLGLERWRARLTSDAHRA